MTSVGGDHRRQNLREKVQGFTVDQPHDWTYGDLHGCCHRHLRTRHWIILSLEAVVLGDEQIEDVEFVGVVGEGVLGLPQL